MRKTHLMALAIIAVAVVLAVGAVAAYAGITTDTQAPVTTTTAVAGYWNTVAITATATDNEGIAYVYNKVDGGPARLSIIAGKPVNAVITIPADKDLPLAAGVHTITYWAQDINGNVEAQTSLDITVGVDTAKPVTTVTGATDGGWYKAGATVRLEAADGTGESGVKELSYALDGAGPTVVASAADVSVPAAAGAHTIVFHATDVAGNAETDRTFTVNIDTTKPRTRAWRSLVARGRTAILKYKVAETGASAGTATVVIKIKNRAHKVVKTIKVGVKNVNASQSAKFKCRLAKGTYKFYVYATDVAGNAQSKVGHNRLTVK